MKTSSTVVALLLLLGYSSIPAEPYDARIANAEILTPAAPLAPRINGPMVYGARPAKQFIYRIPVQGERPIRFQIDGLPAGLKLDPEKGIITGLTPAQTGDYPMSVSVRNSHGQASRAFKLVVGDKLALTPPVGWNSWGGYMLMVSDQVMRKTADMMVEKGLADVGFQYIGIDDCWMRISPENYAARNERKKSSMRALTTKD